MPLLSLRGRSSGRARVSRRARRSSRAPSWATGLRSSRTPGWGRGSASTRTSRSLGTRWCRPAATSPRDVGTIARRVHLRLRRSLDRCRSAARRNLRPPVLNPARRRLLRARSSGRRWPSAPPCSRSSPVPRSRAPGIPGPTGRRSLEVPSSRRRRATTGQASRRLNRVRLVAACGSRLRLPAGARSRRGNVRARAGLGTIPRLRRIPPAPAAARVAQDRGRVPQQPDR